MRMDKYIQDNKEELDIAIKSKVKNPGFKIDNEERRLWILNDEALYNEARRNGVRI